MELKLAKENYFKPRYWETEEDFLQSIRNYFDYANVRKRLPNIAGFTTYLCEFEKPTKRTTIYDYKDIYPDAYAYLEEKLEEEALNWASPNKSDTLKIFYLKNKCGYVDRTETKQDVSMSIEDYFKDNKLEL